jgi:hypothetical protein
MQNTPNDVIDAGYDNNAAARPPEPGARVAPGQSRRDYFDDPRRKSPVLALVLSLMPGLGQVYIGFYQQGFINVLVAASIIALLDTNAMRGAEPLLGIFLAFFWLYNVVDAWRRAVFFNNALAGIGPATLPEEFTVPTGRGSLAGGIALVIVGLVVLSHTLFGVPLDWVEKWWPVAFIAAGAWLIYPTIAGKK